MTEIMKGAFMDRIPSDRAKSHLNVDWASIGVGDGFDATGASYPAVKAHASRMGKFLGRAFRTTSDGDRILVWRIA